LHFHDTGQSFPLYFYQKEEPVESKVGEEKKLRQVEMLTQEPEGELVDGYRRRSAIADAILADFRAAYEARVTKEDIFYYVYGVLHSPEYRTRFASDLKKMLPRLPFTRETADFWRFSQAGRDLAQWHLNYEIVEPWPVQEFTSELLSDPAKDFLVQKMTFGRKDRQVDKTTIHYNPRITLTGIPLAAYDYVVNGKPALEWIMERYQITVDKDSGIRNDPNDWAREHNQPRYILDLLKRIVRVSLETMKIVNALPALNERK
jgi:predicted helicase